MAPHLSYLQDKEKRHRSSVSSVKSVGKRESNEKDPHQLRNLHENKTQKSPDYFRNRGFDKRRRLPTLPHCIAVPSAQVSLTSLFGMGRGGTSPQ